MARRLRECPSGVTQHVIQRGNDRMTCFRVEADYATYAYWLNKAAIEYGVQIHAWAFMTNHTHLLVTPSDANATSRMMQQLGRRYVAYFNKNYERTGTLWEGRFRSCLIDSETYLLRCYRYIELNPVRAQLVSDPALYKWSSHCSNAYGIEAKLCTPHPEYLALGRTLGERLQNYRALFLDELGEQAIAEIRQSVNSGRALSSGSFKRGREGSESTLTPY